ncbi:MAG: NAD(P)H-dependent oxidoreductase [Thiomicrorhabdus chilensis]|uniref:NAD(P)H-dependent oxidoreductase n=1 Tax=Thiomicrorhabdus chilensis TaxID=63656 RepID=UPI00042A44ED|nr:NAD(P)H-dependent oxidoreductase [Thiomicrorhabdus chilensis]MDX1347528.1 NAD(P)H-dependent oxidoreductase [Thiomicrorhabdus chilensis]
MATKRIVIIQGHPDPQKSHYGHALAKAYATGAEAAGHSVEWISVAELDFPLLRSDEEFNHGETPEAIRGAQEKIHKADHLVLFYPLWLGTMPALLKGFIEQVFRPGFAFSYEGKQGFPKKQLKGKSARVVITMGMPGFFYRWFYCAHSLKNLKRNILGFCGIAPVRNSLIGMVEDMKQPQREKWLKKLHDLGKKGL